MACKVIFIKIDLKYMNFTLTNALSRFVGDKTKCVQRGHAVGSSTLTMQGWTGCLVAAGHILVLEMQLVSLPCPAFLLTPLIFLTHDLYFIFLSVPALCFLLRISSTKVRGACVFIFFFFFPSKRVSFLSYRASK